MRSTGRQMGSAPHERTGSPGRRVRPRINSLNRGAFPRPVSLLELFVAVLLTGVALLNAAVPLAAWARSRDGRFALVAGGNLALATLGGLWTWGQLPGNPPPYTEVQLPVLSIVLVAVFLGLAATLWPRHV